MHHVPIRTCRPGVELERRMVVSDRPMMDVETVRADLARSFAEMQQRIAAERVRMTKQGKLSAEILRDPQLILGIICAVIGGAIGAVIGSLLSDLANDLLRLADCVR